MNFFENQLRKMFGESELLSADTVFTGKALIGRIGANTRAKVEFVTDRIADHYEGLKLSIINCNEGVIDSQRFMFHEIIGMKGSLKPYVWDYNGNVDWYSYKPTSAEINTIADEVEHYMAMYVDQDLRYDKGQTMGGM